MNYEEAKSYLYQGNGECGGHNEKLMNDLFFAVTEDKIQKGLAFIKELTSCDDQTAKLIWCDLKLDYGTPVTNPILRAREQYQAEELSKKSTEEYKYRNNAECPYCHSKNTKKISGMSKAGSVAIFGVYAVGKVSKQWHCNNCKSDF